MTVFNEKTEDQLSRQIKPILFNTAKDGSGTWYFGIVDDDGRITPVLAAGENVIGGVKFVDENGDVYGVKHVDNKLRTTSKPYLYDIAEGHLTDHAPFRRHGHNVAVANTWETIYHGSDLYTYLTSAEKLHIISSDAKDTSDGVGARTLYIRGLDGSYDVQSETVTMLGDGTYAVTDKTYLRLLTAYVVTVGSEGDNAGIISIKNTAETATLDTIPVGEGQLHTAIFTIPNGQVGFICDIYMSEQTNKGIEFGLFSRNYGEAWLQKRNFLIYQTPFQLQLSLPYKFTAKTDIELRACGAAVDGVVTAGFSGWREDV